MAIFADLLTGHGATAFVLWCGVLQLLCVLQILRRAWPFRNVRNVVSWACLWAKRVLKQTFSTEKEILHQEVASLQLDFARSYFSSANVCLCGAMSIIQINLVTGRPRWMTPISSWASLVFLSMLTLIVWCPPALSVKTLDLLCFFLNGLVALLVSPLGSKANHSWNIRFFCLIVFQVPSSVFVQNRCLGGVCYVFLTALMLSRSFLAEPEEKLDNFLQYPGTLIMVECVLLPCIYTLVINMRSMVRQKVEARLREHEVSSQLDAASALLELTCDAVMELDEDLRLVEHCPKLADMLLRDKGCASLKRARFTDLVARQDSLRAEQNLTYSQHGASNACANAFHTHLVDSCSSKFRTEVFQVKYQMPSGRQCHLIGLRDFTDLKSLAGDKAADAIHDTCPNDEFDAHGTSLEAPLRQRSERSHASASTSEFSYALAESEPSNQGMKYIDKREVEGVGVVEHTVVLKQKKIFLDLDMQTMLVSAASAPVTSLVGRHLAEIFISEYTMELCNRLCRLAQQSPFLPDSVVSFEHMPLFCAPRVIEITGAMQLARSALGDIHVILSFRQSDQPKTLQL